MARTARKISLRRLHELWLLYINFRRGSVAPSTFKRDYAKFTRRIERMQNEAAHLETAIEIRDWLLANYSAEITRRTLQQFKACGDWAMNSDLIDINPFEGMQKRIPPRVHRETAYAAFTTEERDRIILAFEERYPFYASWVKFLFWTGARPEEAAALRWKHIAPDFRELIIAEALPIGQTEAQSTKNRRVTRFPCNMRLQHLLQSQTLEKQPIDLSREAFVFPGKEGGRFHYTNFQRRYWHPLVSELLESGQVAFYLSQYHARHTWITLALEHLEVQDVSYLARVSTMVIYKHYAGRSRKILIPEF